MSDESTTSPDQGTKTQIESQRPQAPPHTQPVESRRARLRRLGHRARLYTLAFSLVALLVVLIALVIANTRQVKVSWVIGNAHASLVWIIVASAVLGWLLGIVTSVVFRLRTRRRRVTAAGESEPPRSGVVASSGDLSPEASRRQK
jgi:uncharacterized integral membrane protein